jgi:anthranilate synthase component 1
MEVMTKRKQKLKVKMHRMLSDMVTPVALYLKARDHFTDPVLLENNDFRSKEDSFTFLGFDRIGSIQIQNGDIRAAYPGGIVETSSAVDIHSVPEAMKAYLQRFELEYQGEYNGFNGLIGYTSFDAVQYFDTLQFDSEKRKLDLPDIQYNLYRFVLAINLFRDEITILENIPEGEPSQMQKMINLIQAQNIGVHEFQLRGAEESNLTDEAFRELVRLGKKHCQLGDVFQIVFSRQFSRKFSGDDFNVYRVLRSINPSPYLFYADFGGFRVFGSSPETQMSVRQGTATVNPIAGTYKRTGNNAEDAQKAMELAKDPKENAEHIMLVDLARNDLGRHAVDVEVKELKDIQFFSHVIHLVSKVTGQLPAGTNPVQVFADTFPAGTLSGAPKYKALELINQYENQNRSLYGGALGYIDFNGEMNNAIVIRSFLSRNNTLYYQAGAGIVVASDEEKELQEVNNKLGALTKALLEAEKLK